MDIRKLQRAIVDGLEDVKGQDIQVFNTEHLSPLFERVIVVSGQSNRQTKALAASVRDAVKKAGLSVLRTEGEENGEWIIVDCGAAVAHVMQPSIRDYYRLEEIWGGKPVKIKLNESTGGLVKAEGYRDDEDDEEAPKPKARSRGKPAVNASQARNDDDTPAKKVALKTSSKTSSKTPAKAVAKPVAKTTRNPAQATRPSAGKTAAAKGAAAKTAAVKTAAVKKLTAREAAATKPAGSQRGVAKPAPKTAAGKLSAAKATRAGSTAVRSGAAPAKTANVKKVVVPANSSRNAANSAKKTATRSAATKAAAAKKSAARRG